MKSWVYWETKDVAGHGYLYGSLVKVINCPMNQKLEGKKIKADLVLVYCNVCYCKECTCNKIIEEL